MTVTFLVLHFTDPFAVGSFLVTISQQPLLQRLLVTATSKGSPKPTSNTTKHHNDSLTMRWEVPVIGHWFKRLMNLLRCGDDLPNILTIYVNHAGYDATWVLRLSKRKNRKSPKFNCSKYKNAKMQALHLCCCCLCSWVVGRTDSFRSSPDCTWK